MESSGLRSLKDLDPSRLYVLPTGVGYAFTRRFYHSSFLMICGGKVTLIDAPAPLRRVLWAAGRQAGFDIDLQHVDQLLLTHLHGDHCNGVEELAFWRMYRVTAPAPKLYLLRELRAPLWYQRLFAAMGGRPGDRRDHLMLESYFDVYDLAVGQLETFRIPGFTLEPRYTRHFVPTIAFRVNFNGITLGYSADTEYDPELIEFLSGCDMIIHETSPGPGHTPPERLCALPAETKAKMFLTHLPDDFEASNCDIPPLREGQLYEVRKGGAVVV